MPTPPSPQNRHDRRRRIKRITLCAMFIALGVVVLYFGALLEILELCVAALAAMLLFPLVIEYGRAYPWAVWAATSLLSLLLLPYKMPGAVYLLFGYYPILKAYLERLPRPFCRLLKEIVFAAGEIGIILASHFLVGIEQMPVWYNALLFVLGSITLHLFDIALTRLITLYARKYQQRLRRWMN